MNADFAQAPPPEKTRQVEAVFRRAARRYDLMNDVISLGMHRGYKRAAALLLGARAGMRALDLAGGSGDMARLIAPQVAPGQAPGNSRSSGDSRLSGDGKVWLADINDAMLACAAAKIGMDPAIEIVRCDAEELPFARGFFDRVVVAFGLRNITDKAGALAEVARVLRPGGIAVILEFARPAPNAAPYRAYLKTLPAIGRLVAGDAASYRYLAESILDYPPAGEITAMLLGAGLECAEHFNCCGGMISLHRARRGLPRWTA